MKVLTVSQVSQAFLTNPSRFRIYLCKIPNVITKTLIGPVHMGKSYHQNYLAIVEIVLLWPRWQLLAACQPTQFMHKHFPMSMTLTNSSFLLKFLFPVIHICLWIYIKIGIKINTSIAQIKFTCGYDQMRFTSSIIRRLPKTILSLQQLW
jgi:hypothetical protein